MNLAHNDDYFETPNWLFKDLENWIGKKFTLDASASKENTKCETYFSEQVSALDNDWDGIVFNNPPRSINGKFITKAYEQSIRGVEIVQLICWNDLGNKYCDPIREKLGKEIKFKNYGKITFAKNGFLSKFPSRLTYLAIWYNRQ